jgi:uncharacterized protein DUF6152
MKGRLLLIAACALWLMSTGVAAHHALSEYDDARVTTLEGTLSEIRIKNPHSQLTIETSGASGTERWTVEWLAALVLKKEGIENTTLKPGDRLVVSGNPARDGKLRRLWLRTVARPADGWSWKGRF